MTREELIEAVARKMAAAGKYDPDTAVTASIGYTPTVGDCPVVIFPGDLSTFKGPRWWCYRKSAEIAVDFVTEAAK